MDEQESLLAAINEDVQLHTYDSSWPTAFAVERERLSSVVPDTFLELQHIGSTSIPGMHAKPIIDILAGVASMKIAKSIAEPLCASGYTTSADFNATLTDRQWFMRWANGRRTHHLHVVVHGSTAWNERLRFRDRLRRDATLAQRYALLKVELAEKFTNDREAYTDAKAEFVRAVIAADRG
jgi:GrpB-like predicted nucleotidyltransferase (UPF0157 family)